MSSDKVYIVTGANIGLGFETTRQLALMKSTKTVYMACRSEEKAKNAIKELVSKHRVPKGILKFIKFDGSSSKETIYALADSMPDKTVHGLILNAGGMVSVGWCARPVLPK